MASESKCRHTFCHVLREKDHLSPTAPQKPALQDDWGGQLGVWVPLLCQSHSPRELAWNDWSLSSWTIQRQGGGITTSPGEARHTPKARNEVQFLWVLNSWREKWITEQNQGFVRERNGNNWHLLSEFHACESRVLAQSDLLQNRMFLCIPSSFLNGLYCHETITWSFSKAVKTEPSHDPAMAAGCTSKKWNAGSQRDAFTPCSDTTVHSNQEVEATKMSTPRWMAKQNLVFTQDIYYYLSVEKKEILSQATAWVDLEDITLGRGSQSQKTNES